MNKLILSIIIPIYKVEDYLSECVNSVINQTYKNLEIILVDDGSPDNCPTICDEYARKDDRIKVIHKTNGGLSDARNAGIEVAKGQYILFLDGDDMLRCDSQGQQWLSSLLAFLEQTKLPVYFFSCIEEFPPQAAWKLGNCLKVVKKNKFLKKFFFKVPYQAGWLYILNRDFLIKNSLFFKKDLLHEDEEWIPRIILSLSEGQNIGVVSFPLYRYRLNRCGSITNGSHTRRQKARLSIMESFAMLYPKLTKQNQKFIATRIAQLYTGLVLDKSLDLGVKKQLGVFKGFLLKSKCIKHWGIYILQIFRGLI